MLMWVPLAAPEVQAGSHACTLSQMARVDALER